MVLVDGDLAYGIVSLRNSAMRDRFERELEFQANFDMVTGLANRALFLDRLSREYGITRQLSAHAERVLEEYRWPGNVRELRSIAAVGYGMAEGDLIVHQGNADLEGTYGGWDGPFPPWNDEHVQHYETTVDAVDVDSLGLASGFTLGLQQALKGKASSTADVDKELADSWSRADTWIRSSAF